MAISPEYLSLRSLWEKALFGSYLVVPLKYDDAPNMDYIRRVFKPIRLETTDIGENIKDLVNKPGQGNIGQAYSISKEVLKKELLKDDFCQLTVKKDDHEGSFSFLDSYLYVFHTKVAFLCIGFAYTELATLEHICNPGFVALSCEYIRTRADGYSEVFSFEDALASLTKKCGMEKFFDGNSPAVVESYTYTLALVPERLPSIEVMRQATFNLHQMTDLNMPAQDEAEEDLRYVYAVKTQSLGSYRWGCCISSQTMSYIFADDSMDLEQNMAIQGPDGLPVVMLALYEKFTCLRFTELLTQSAGQNEKHLDDLKKMMLKFQAYGTVTPSNLSRWHNVKQIYAALLEVNDTSGAIADIDAKLNILSEQQQDIRQRKSDAVSWIITIFGIVSIIDSTLSIVNTLIQGHTPDWITVLGTIAALAVVTLVVLRSMKKQK